MVFFLEKRRITPWLLVFLHGSGKSTVQYSEVRDSNESFFLKIFARLRLSVILTCMCVCMCVCICMCVRVCACVCGSVVGILEWTITSGIR